jgi:tRNA(adenine34) deaminase
MVYKPLLPPAPHIDFMRMALVEAGRAAARGEVPVGALLVDGTGKVLARNGNRCIEWSDPAGHAEIVVLREAGRKVGNYRLAGTVMYVTLEPCAMCAAALVHARVAELVFGALDPKAGAVISLYNIVCDNRLNHQLQVEAGVLAEECGVLLREFFRGRREEQAARRKEIFEP